MNHIDVKIVKNDILTTAFRAAIITGIVAHGYMLFNKISYHDDMCSLFGLGGTYGLGRWALGIIGDILELTVGIYSAPLFIGSISIIFIGMSAALVCDILGVRSKLGAAYIGAVMAAFPAVASIFAFMFTAGIYFLSLFLSVVAVYILSKQHTVKRCLAAACLIAICTGIYQAFLASSVSLMLMVLIIHILDHPDRKFMVHLKEALTYGAVICGGMGLYFVANKICLAWKDTELSSYQGINGSYDILQLPSKIEDVYHSFLGGGYEGINAQHFLSHSVKGVIVLTMIGFLLIVYRSQADKLSRLWVILLLSVFPIAVYLVKLFSTEENFDVHTLMVYSLVYVYILPVCLLERVDHNKAVEGINNHIIKGGKCVLSTILMLLMLIYMYYDNIAYLKMNFIHEQTTSYFNTLVTQIKSTQGYRDEYPVVLLGYREIEDLNFFSTDEFSRIMFTGYEYEQKDLVNDYTNISYLGYYLGFEPDIMYADAADYWALEEVQNMSCYPDSGSIKVIDEAVIVKFAESE